ncbi:RCC1 domain-containing protein [uncultured Fibrella sp.]|uniref:RCC1 domain-containing protein n=1 Tax=uncultured Fibrella sp. TaxID=1284596 RepID=UPI0035CBE2C7
MKKNTFFCLIFAFLTTISCKKTDVNNTTSPTNIALVPGTTSTNNVFASYTYSTVYIKKDGSLWTFGKGEFIGRDPAVTILTPQQVGVDKDWQSVSTGHATFAIKSDGTLWFWGTKDRVGRTGNNLIPAKVNEDKDWVSVYWAPNEFTLAIKKDGSLWGCGKGGFTDGTSYFLDGTTTDRPLISRVGTDVDWQKISVFGARIFLIKKDGSVWGWGFPNIDLFGVLDTKSKLVKVLPGNDWVDVAVRTNGAVALKKDGTLWQWGAGRTSQQVQQVGTDTDWVRIIAKTALYNEMYALKKDGSLWYDVGVSGPPVSFFKLDTYNAGDTYDSIYALGSGMVAKRAGKDEYCSYGLSNIASDYVFKYGGNVLISDAVTGKCASL